MSTERFNYTNEGEIFALGSKINAFCDLTPDTFDPAVHVVEAQEIVEALAPRIRASSSSQLSMRWNLKGLTSVLRGTTEHGDVSITDENRIRGEKTFTTRHEYRIGNYVVRGRSRRLSGKDTLVFEHFWKRSMGSRVDENPPSQLEITYNRQTLEPTWIASYEFVTKAGRLGSIEFSRSVAHPTTLWKAEKNGRK